MSSRFYSEWRAIFRPSTFQMPYEIHIERRNTDARRLPIVARHRELTDGVRMVEGACSDSCASRRAPALNRARRLQSTRARPAPASERTTATRRLVRRILERGFEALCVEGRHTL